MERDAIGTEIVCRCEEVAAEEIMEAIRNGADSLDAVKKATRAGMGFCQGRTCKRLIARMLSCYYGMPVDRYLPGSLRLPVTPIRLSLLAETQDDPREGERAATCEKS
ncbi:MAG TPA: (2Fe-2S)-binding protein [Clostridia bacterium]|nr:(2Fe-2S)-binding protein [Clostridia bacterium]